MISCGNRPALYPDCTTTPLGVGASELQLIAALEELKTIGKGGIINVTRTIPEGHVGINSYTYQITFSQTQGRYAIGEVPLLKLHTLELRYVDRNNSKVAVKWPHTGMTLPTREDVDMLLEFSHYMGANYTGKWLNARSLEITFTDTEGYASRRKTRVEGPETQRLAVSVRPNWDIFANGGGTSAQFKQSAKLTMTADGRFVHPRDYRLRSADMSSVASADQNYVGGSWGEMAPPTLLRARVDDPRDCGGIPCDEKGVKINGLSIGDVVHYMFDTPTNTPAVHTKELIDAILEISLYVGCCTPDDRCGTKYQSCVPYKHNPVHFGTNYTGTWVTERHLKVTIVDPTVPETSAELASNKASGLVKASFFMKIDYDLFAIRVQLKGAPSPLRSADLSSTPPVILKGCIACQSPVTHESCPATVPCGETGELQRHGVLLEGSWGPEIAEGGFKGVLYMGIFGLFVVMLVVMLGAMLYKSVVTVEESMNEV